MLLRPVSEPDAAFRKLNDPVWWLPHEAAEEVVRINGNSQRRVRKEETRMRVNTLAKQLQTTGVPDEDVATRLGKILPFTQAYIDSLLSSEFKRRDHVHSPGRPSRGLQYSVNPEKRLPDSERVATSQEYVDASNGPTLLTTGATQAEALRSLSNPIFQEKFAIWSKTIAAISAVSAGIFPSGAQKASLKVTGNPTNVFALLMKIAPEFDMKDRVELQLALEDGQ